MSHMAETINSSDPAFAKVIPYYFVRPKPVGAQADLEVSRYRAEQERKFVAKETQVPNDTTTKRRIWSNMVGQIRLPYVKKHAQG